jgi:TRAP-type mannitol/chloroaromatic compound transport system permease small subunit
MLCLVFLYLLNNYLVYWQGLPSPHRLLFGLPAERGLIDWIMLKLYAVALLGVALWAYRRRAQGLVSEAERLQRLAAYLVRSMFWAVLLIGVVDAIISFLRVQDLLGLLVSEQRLAELGRPAFRGSWVHFPLILSSFVFAWRWRRISFAWLSLLVVLAEFLIVISRFVFSYEQAFMGDLVRFWYAALFLFASSHTLLHDGHVRVDVLYAGFSRTRKAWSNIIGSLMFGLPLCWVILLQGMGGRGNSINSPLLSFEISQSGYGMYVKYLMAGFLVVFAVTMIIQFTAYVLSNIAALQESDVSSRAEAASAAKLDVKSDLEPT